MLRFHRHARWLAPLAALLFVAACADDPDANANQSENQTENQSNQETAEACEVDSWSCAEFEDGFALSITRHGHHSFYLGDDLVLLYGGSERDENFASSRAESWEVVNVDSGEIVEFGEYESERRNPSVIQLDNGGVLAVGGVRIIGSGTLYLETMEYFDIPSLSWTQAPEMNEGYTHATKLSDGNVLAMNAEQSGGTTELVGQVFDTQAWEWSSIEGAELPHDEVWDLTFDATNDGRVVLGYRFLAPEELQPEEEGIDLFYAASAIFDPATGELTAAQEFEGIEGLNLLVDVTTLPESGQVLINLRPFDLEDELETSAFIVDPSDDSIEPLFTRDPPPGAVIDVWPGDEVIYRSNSQIQRFDVDQDRWRNFTDYPQSIYYSTTTMLPDCTLFVSGERTLNAPNDELRGVDTGYCHPE